MNLCHLGQFISAPPGLHWRPGAILPLVARLEEPAKLQRGVLPPFHESDRELLARGPLPRQPNHMYPD